ncbi:hypothetical protein TGVEG_214310 [Toxoplasma gondii VEG]|uniref:Uncharacterized protein n=4 Tax=Toxoplasma gondii TaxID=5811 RepID=V4ZFN5_TOXGV|nr:hypothetical protein TGVEG_214310 [Toxoplasma gondii VEG]KFG38974.1 hypothetical protein TGFOU_214310 [Toxoplasma gondii FOU]PUA86463.1 hypothetical protein TGBR9_214310 [Toxoplasma gondii TgCATBr9]RQX70007.1 hypothetical protein TGCAST_214310 [Toxoplasma gondii CAST]CEL77026.1 TPA: hypothetical protein BN1205_031560 [Toxoplasma gondii VEG]
MASFSVSVTRSSRAWLHPVTETVSQMHCRTYLHGTAGRQLSRCRCARGIFSCATRPGIFLRQARPHHQRKIVRLAIRGVSSSRDWYSTRHESAASLVHNLRWEKFHQRGRNPTATFGPEHGMRSAHPLPSTGGIALVCSDLPNRQLTGCSRAEFSRCLATRRGVRGSKVPFSSRCDHSHSASCFASSFAPANGRKGEASSSEGVFRQEHTSDERVTAGLERVSGIHRHACERCSQDARENVELLDTRRKQVLNNLPAYVRLVESGPIQVVIYPIVHGNAETVSHVPRTGDCGTSTEASQLIRVLHPDFVFFGADPSARKGGESSYSQALGWPSSFGILPRVFGGFLPFSDIQEPLAAADHVHASVGFLDRPKAATTNRLHQQLLQNSRYSRAYLDYASACRTLKKNSRVQYLGGEQMLKESSALSHQLMFSFPEGYETLVVERVRYMAGRLAECLSSAFMEGQISLAPIQDPDDNSKDTQEVARHRVVSVVVCDSVLAERMANAVKRIVGDPAFIRNHFTKNATSRSPSNGNHALRFTSYLEPPAVSTYKNPYEGLAVAPVSQLPLLFFQIFVLPSLLAWLLMWQVQLLVGRGFSSHPLGDLPILQKTEAVELDLGGEKPVVELGRGRRRFVSGVNAQEESLAGSDIACGSSSPRSTHTLWPGWKRFVPSNILSLFSSGPLGRYTDRR